MNCREFESLVLDLARNQSLDAATRAPGLEHAELCVKCAARLAEEREWLANVRLVVTELALQEAPAHLEANLLAALHEQAVRKQSVLPSPVARWWSWKFAAAVAALLLVVLLAGALWRNFSREPKPTVQRAPAPPIVPASPPVTVNDNTVIAKAPKQRPAPVRRAPPRRNVRSSLAPPGEEATPFYSLVEEGTAIPLESGRIVRVELPASTFIPFGLPLTAEAMTQSVQADLLLGQDGLARAIRFVPNSQSTRTQ